MTLGYHMNDMYWEDVLHETVRLGYRSHMTSTCGLHVHVNRDAFGETRDEQEKVIERVLYFMECDMIRKSCLRICGCAYLIA